MTSTLLQFPDPFETLSKLPALVVGPLGGVIVTPDGEFEAYRLSELRNMLQGHDFLICNRPVCERHLQADLAKCFDILELFAFIRPAEFCLPLLDHRSAKWPDEPTRHRASRLMGRL